MHTAVDHVVANRVGTALGQPEVHQCIAVAVRMTGDLNDQVRILLQPVGSVIQYLLCTAQQAIRVRREINPAQFISAPDFTTIHIHRRTSTRVRAVVTVIEHVVIIVVALATVHVDCSAGNRIRALVDIVGDAVAVHITEAAIVIDRRTLGRICTQILAVQYAIAVAVHEDFAASFVDRRSQRRVQTLIHIIRHTVLVGIADRWWRCSLVTKRILHTESGDPVGEVVVFFKRKPGPILATDRKCASSHIPAEAKARRRTWAVLFAA